MQAEPAVGPDYPLPGYRPVHQAAHQINNRCVRYDFPEPAQHLPAGNVLKAVVDITAGYPCRARFPSLRQARERITDALNRAGRRSSMAAAADR